MPTVGSTIQLFAQAYDQDDLPITPGINRSTTDAGVATVSGSGLVTVVASGICNIKATAVDNIAAVGQTSVGVALLSANSLTIAYGNNATISSVGGFTTVNWSSGASGAAQVYAGTIVNGFVVADHSSTAWNSGPTATIVTLGWCVTLFEEWEPRRRTFKRKSRPPRFTRRCWSVDATLIGGVGLRRSSQPFCRAPKATGIL